MKIIGALSFFLLLSACGKNTISVDIHGVNYVEAPFFFVMFDPSDPSRPRGGELIGSFGAGGIVCCYELPKKWRPGLRIGLRAHDALKRDSNGDYVEQNFTFEVPKYADGKPGEIWVQRFDDRSFGLVLSDYQPNHPAWPGRIKGWPVPSLEYRRKRWDLFIKSEEGDVRNYEKLLALLDADPDKAAKRTWDFERSQFEDLKKFSGPEDPTYRAMLRKRYLEGLQDSQASLKKLQEERP
jgi:hypothetical protein